MAIKTLSNILILGSGGREHALARACLQAGSDAAAPTPTTSTSTSTRQVWVAPGNDGMAQEPAIQCIPCPQAIDDIIVLAQELNIDLIIPGPEGIIAQGIADACIKAQIPCFAPTQAAAQLESSKIFAKDFMQKWQIPTAQHHSFHEEETALAWLSLQNDRPLVFKANGLAAGKGVVVCHDPVQRAPILSAMMRGQSVGDAGHAVVIEEFLSGEELSYIIMAHNGRFISMASSQDHKLLQDFDKGPNTGGMGAYSPAPVMTKQVEASIIKNIVEPTLQGLNTDTGGFTGFLYIGLMIDAKGLPCVIEFNVRFGDPEAQAVLARLEGDLARACYALMQNDNGQDDNSAAAAISWSAKHAVTVVLASGGYPTTSMLLHQPIQIIPAPSAATVSYAGVKQQGDTLVNTGGRVLAVTALASSTSQAAQEAYAKLKNITMEGGQYRTDIAYRAIAREHNTYE